MEVVWTEEAHASFHEIIDFIDRKFTQREIDNFILETFSTIEVIKNYPDLFPASKIKALKSSRKAVIHPHSTLFYIIRGKKEIVLLLFWDNRKDINQRR